MDNYFDDYYRNYYDNFRKDRESKINSVEEKIKKFKWKDSIEYKCLFKIGYKNGLNTSIYNQVEKLKVYIQKKEAEVNTKRDIAKLLIKDKNLVDTTQVINLECKIINVNNKLQLDSDFDSLIGLCEEENDLMKLALNDGNAAVNKDVDNRFKELYLILNERYAKILLNLESAIFNLTYDNEVIEKCLSEYDKIDDIINDCIEDVEMLKANDKEKIKDKIDLLVKLINY